MTAADPAGPVLVADLGGHRAQVAARRIRDRSVHSRIVSRRISAAEVAERRPSGLVFPDGPGPSTADEALIDPAVLELGVPILGLGRGARILAHLLGRDLEEGDAHRFEDAERRIIAVDAPSDATGDIEDDAVVERFLHEFCRAERSWTPEAVVAEQVDAVRRQVGDAKVICALSGGVDSAVAAALVHRAIGPQLTCVFVDTGLMRLDEGDQVVETFQRHQRIELIHVRAADRFFAALQGLTDPEEKRKAIGELFIRIFEQSAGGVEDARFLVQGTLYPDVIESGTESSSAIKSHHNVGGLPEDMEFDLVEPLRDLFKEEVRAVGLELGLPEEIVWRQPFPGPGLGVRIIGEVTPEKVDLLQRADAVVRDEIRGAGLEREIWQAFAVLPDIRSVGVHDGERSYGHPIIIRAVRSEDAMSAEWARLPHELLDRMAKRIIADVEGINRVAYDITSKPPGTIEWE